MSELPRCACVIERDAMLEHADDHDLRRACTCAHYPPNERCDCAFCSRILAAVEVAPASNIQ